jgi:uncharacterized protein
VDVVLPRAWRRESAWHGEAHWQCVTATGLELAAAGGDTIDRALVFCFGLLHDTRRVNEAVDREHGRRAADFARGLHEEGVLLLDEQRVDTLIEALGQHADGRVSSDPTVGTCWDADRLHLPRVSIVPDPALLSTQTALEPERLVAAELLRSGPPSWDALITRAERTA